MTLLILIILAVVIELRYRPRLEKANGDLLVWYRFHRYTRKREFINLSQLYREIFNKF